MWPSRTGACGGIWTLTRWRKRAKSHERNRKHFRLPLGGAEHHNQTHASTNVRKSWTLPGSSVYSGGGVVKRCRQNSKFSTRCPSAMNRDDRTRRHEGSFAKTNSGKPNRMNKVAQIGLRTNPHLRSKLNTLSANRGAGHTNHLNRRESNGAGFVKVLLYSMPAMYVILVP